MKVFRVVANLKDKVEEFFRKYFVVLYPIFCKYLPWPFLTLAFLMLRMMHRTTILPEKIINRFCKISLVLE